MERYRARLVVKGYAQKEGIDFNEKISPMVRMITIRAVLTMCATYDIHLDQYQTPFPTDVKLSSKMSPISKEEWMKMSRVPSVSVVESIMFAIICTRPNIAHAVGVVCRYMEEPGREHWEAVKRILRYIKGTSDVALCFGE
ncbi:gag-pol polyprotein [Tanacetum coccineum]